MNDVERAQRIREIIRRLEALQPDCARRILRQREVQEAVARAQHETEAALEPESAAFRLFDRMRKERTFWWRVEGEYASPDDCEKLEELINNLGQA